MYQEYATTRYSRGTLACREPPLWSETYTLHVVRRTGSGSTRNISINLGRDLRDPPCISQHLIVTHRLAPSRGTEKGLHPIPSVDMVPPRTYSRIAPRSRARQRGTLASASASSNYSHKASPNFPLPHPPPPQVPGQTDDHTSSGTQATLNPSVSTASTPSRTCSPSATSP